jgi:hypothetical protein
MREKYRNPKTCLTLEKNLYRRGRKAFTNKLGLARQGPPNLRWAIEEAAGEPKEIII